MRKAKRSTRLAKPTEFFSHLQLVKLPGGGKYVKGDQYDKGNSTLELPSPEMSDPNIVSSPSTKRKRKPNVRLIEELDDDLSSANGSRDVAQDSSRTIEAQKKRFRSDLSRGKPGKEVAKNSDHSPDRIRSNPYSRRSRKQTDRFSSMQMVKMRYEHAKIPEGNSDPKHSEIQSDLDGSTASYPASNDLEETSEMGCRMTMTLQDLSSFDQAVLIAQPVLPRRGLPAQAISMEALNRVPVQILR